MSSEPALRRPDPSAYRVLIVAARDHWWALPLLVLLGLLMALTEGIGIGLMIPLFATMFESGDKAGGIIVTFVGRFGEGLGEQQRILLLVGLVVGLVVLKAGIQYAYQALSVWVSGRVIYRLRISLFNQLLDFGLAFFANGDPGRLFDIIRGQTWLAGQLLMLISRAVVSLSAIAVFSILLVFVSPLLALGAGAGAMVIALFVRVVVRRTRLLGRETVEASAALSKRTIEALGSMRVIRLFGQEKRECERFSEVAERNRAASQGVEIAEAMIRPATELFYTPLFLGILVAAWGTGFAFPTLIAFMLLLYRLQPHARQLDQIRVEMAGLLPGVQQIAGLLRREDKPYVVSGQESYPGLRHGVQFQDVSLVYRHGPEERQAAVTGLTFEITKNRVTALVGESGGGKSTIVNLLFRLYDPTSGTILVDGVPLTKLRLADWRRALAFAGQDADLIGDTILDAILYGRPDADFESVKTAAQRANAEEFIAKLPMGYDTPIGERGLQLSAGQRQRIGLARALLCNPEILVLDEATSALDSVSENLIQESLEQLRGHITIIVIAHRLSTIRDADHVLVLRGGRLVEQGCPQSLAHQPDSVFAELWRLQSGAFGTPEKEREMEPLRTSVAT